ncbi:MAG TPA: PilZ domain-containing protein [Candidatus Aquilonibacter sp.]|nr:PilZ domain-containing protein [Candidatus Aquilonibacter sp.]
MTLMHEAAHPAVLYPSPATCYQKERRHQRFQLRLPVHLSFAANGLVRQLEGVSRNVSTSSLLFRANEPIPVHTHVALTITVECAETCRHIQLRGEGEVVRIQQARKEAGFLMAVACSRPITEMTARAID